MSAEVKTVLPQGAGYAVVVGIGFFFAALMIGVSYIQVNKPYDFRLWRVIFPR